MKNVIKIKIPSDTTDEQFGEVIKKRLNQKMLSGSGVNKNVKMIGQYVEVLQDNITIKVERIYNEPIIEMATCNVCNSEYQNTDAKYYFHNYGGKTKKVAVCSNECIDFMVENFGVRVSKTKSKLKPFIIH